MDQRGQSEETTGTTSKLCPVTPAADSVDFSNAVYDDLGYLPLDPFPDNLRMELVQGGTGQIQHKSGPYIFLFVVVRGRSLSAKWFRKIYKMVSWSREAGLYIRLSKKQCFAFVASFRPLQQQRLSAFIVWQCKHRFQKLAEIESPGGQSWR